MARFQYKMQNILDIKYKLETQAKTAFAEAAARLAYEEESLRKLRERRAAYEEEAKELVSSKLEVRKIQECRLAIEVMKEYIKNQLVAVHIAQRNLESARIRLNDVMTERKTHEKLKEREFEEFKREVEGEESKAIDELVSYSYRGKMTE